ncbi:PQQ-binding-like beta-propeller repeat protein [Streptomyces sp. NPDC051561]|uniref:outer membrane protein assembly factor BamB family protein n=1 Tax=Streptomyces sp. NPDC051561 TaxID=3365658 RepID=UPI003799BBEF
MTQPPNEPPQDGAQTPGPFSKQPQTPPGFGAPTPPPPGQQPGFGAPTPPPPAQQPGFGAPTPPPPGQQPGYGYPQAPGQQPQGAPATPPPPAGQPPQTPPPAGYGFPGQQPPAGQQPPPYGYPAQTPAPPTVPQPLTPSGSTGGGSILTTQLKIIIAAVVAVVLIVGGGVVYKATSSDDPKDVAGGSAGGTGGAEGKGEGGAKPAPDGAGKEQAPANVTAKVGFQVPLPTVKEITKTKGSWATDTIYARAAVNSVVGYDPQNGTEKWKIPLSGSPCGGSAQITQDNKAAIVFEGTKAPGEKVAQCTEAGVIDLASGKLLWQKSFPDGDRKVRLSMATISGNTVAVAGYSGGGAFNLADGKELWSPKPTADQCKDKGYAGGPGGLVAVRECGDYDNETYSIETLNPADGKPISKFKMPDNSKYVSVLSVKPLVVGANVGEAGEYKTKVSDVFSVDEKTGKLRARIGVDSERYPFDCDLDDVGGCTQVAVGNGKLYLPTAEHQGQAETGRTNEIVTFDLATGKPTGDNYKAGERYHMVPLRMDGGNLIVYKFPPYDKGGQVASIDGGTGKETLLLDNPADRSVRDAEQTMTIKMDEVRYHKGRLYMGTTLISADPSSSKKYLALAFVPAQ